MVVLAATARKFSKLGSTCAVLVGGPKRDPYVEHHPAVINIDSGVAVVRPPPAHAESLLDAVARGTI